MQKPEFLATGHMWDHIEHSWVSVIDWETFACNLCNNQEIKTLFQPCLLLPVSICTVKNSSLVH